MNDVQFARIRSARRVTPCLVSAIAMAGVALALAQSSGAAEAPPLARAAQMTPLAKRAVMEAVAIAGDHVIAVGERGVVLRSADVGRTWQQAATPVSVTLTAVQFIDADHGWAVGHSGVVLSTQDGGAHWTKQLDGEGAARLAMAEAQALGSTPALLNARRLLKDGADKPFLSLSFRDLSHGTVVGAYGLAMHTDDGGKTWQSWSGRVGDSRALHLYAVTQLGDAIWVAGEQGFVARSVDAGATFNPVQTPYKGSFFALDLAPNGTVVLGGLLGNVLRSSDGGASFDPVKLDGPVTIADVRYTGKGQWLVANAAGQIFASSDQANTFTPLINHPMFPLSGIALDTHGTVIGAGFAGVSVVATAGDTAMSSQRTAADSVSGGKQ